MASDDSCCDVNGPASAGILFCCISYCAIRDFFCSCCRRRNVNDND
jgi:hypothetical protein